MLQRDGDSPLSERQRKMVEEAERSCARLVALVAELSDVSKIDAGLVTFADQPLELFSLVQDVAGNVHESGDRDVRLELRGAAAGAAMAGDAPRLRTAFESIFKAILREQPSACTVVADRRLEQDGASSCAVVVIAEAGAVQSAYASPAGPFDEKRGGLGLLLPIARRVIERHGGRISSPATPDGAADQRAGRGAVIISFPLGVTA
jgi:signal transduction histidine kinase